MTFVGLVAFAILYIPPFAAAVTYIHCWSYCPAVLNPQKYLTQKVRKKTYTALPLGENEEKTIEANKVFLTNHRGIN